MKSPITLIKENMNKFSFAQMTSNSDGKTSGSGAMGVYICFFGIIGFLFGCIDKALLSKTADIMMYSTGVITIGAGLLGYRKSKDKLVIPTEEAAAGGDGEAEKKD